MAGIVTLLSDFGLRDSYVASLKGVILSICPEARLVDITHLIPPQDLRAGAFLLATVYRDFPPDTVHLAIVDPGVGTDRHGVVLQSGRHYFVGPDNGLFSWICGRESGWQAWSLDNSKYWRFPISPIFHGRDIFAPVAAHLANGVLPAAMGTPWTPLIADWSTIERSATALRGEVVAIDYFGNVITNLDAQTLSAFAPADCLVVHIAERSLHSLRITYAAEPPGSLMALIGSHGFLEVAANHGHAGDLLAVQAGEPVLVERRK